jgi:phosphosulfolactate synthase (CoM biosynthesis protein A)
MSDHCIDVNPLLFEVPTAVQRRQIVTRIGPIVNVGNSQPSDLFGLETIELQLRSETLAAFEPLVAQFAIEVA